MLNELFQEVFDKYQSVRDEYKRAKPGMPLEDEITSGIPRALREVANLSRRYGIKGSLGQYNLFMPEVPWIEVYDREITDESAKRGYYIVYLFRADMSGVYLSLNQGYTQYKDRYGSRRGKKEIRKNTQIAKNLISSSFPFSKAPIDLRGKNDTSKGYELGDICNAFYSKEDFPNDEKLGQDLIDMLAPYKELRGKIGKYILSISEFAYQTDIEEDELKYQKEVQEEEYDFKIPEGPIDKPERATKGNNNTPGPYKRDRKMAQKALKTANYQCENDNSHSTFKVKGKNHQYVEAHHLIPMEYQDQFENCIDVPENIVSLCPNCHRKIHHAQMIERENMVKKLLKYRKEMLGKRGIVISYTELSNYID